MDASIFDPVQGYAAGVRSTGELRVEASIPSTVNVNVSSSSTQVETTPGAGSGSGGWNQVDIASSSGGTQIVASGTRKGFILANLDTVKTVYLGFGGTAPTTSTGFPVGPGATFALPAGVTTSEEIKGITSAGTARIAYVQFT